MIYRCAKFSRYFRLATAFRNLSSACAVNEITELPAILQSHVSSLSNVRNSNAVDYKNLQPRRTSDSYAKALLPLASNASLKEKYLNFLGYVRFGLILEDLDTFAVWLAYRHNQTGSLMGQAPIHHPMALVTACVDRIDLTSPKLISSDCDIIFEGEVTWTGHYSLETTIRLFQDRTTLPKAANRDGTETQNDQLLEAKFVIVAIDPATHKPVPIHPLKPETSQEIKMFQLGEANKQRRLRQTEECLLKMPPSAAETALIHELFLQTSDPNMHCYQRRILPSNYTWMEECKLKNVIICFPQQRNIYNKIFGGFLMRSAFELAYANAASFSFSYPVTLAVNDIIFRNPVDIGCLLYLSSEICYTTEHRMQVRVNAEVINIEKKTQTTTNTFYFTFLSGDEKPLKKVIPRSYSDGMLYIAGRRQFYDY